MFRVLQIDSSRWGGFIAIGSIGRFPVRLAVIHHRGNSMKFIYSCLPVLIALAATPAHASEDQGGARAEVTLGWDRLGTGPSGAKSGVSYGGEVGYDSSAGIFQIGPYAFLDGSSARNCAGASSTSGNVSQTVSGCIKSSRTFGIGARVGMPIRRNILLYGKIGYVNSRLNSNLIQTTTTTTTGYNYISTYSTYGSIVNNSDQGGFQIGLGTQIRLAHKVYAKIEYTYSDLGHNQLGTTNYHFTRNRVTSGIGLRF